MENQILSPYWEQCKQAHGWTSFFPERRADQMVNEWSQILENDLKQLGDNQGNYKQKFIEKWLKWVNSKANCASSMITGSANFNVRRNEKALNIERANYLEFEKWRAKYFQAVNRVSTLSPEEELDLALAELDHAKARQELMKEANKILRKYKDLTAFEHGKILLEHGFDVELIKEACQFNGRLKFAQFTLTNNNAKIKRLEQKLITMKRRIETKNTFQDIKFQGGLITISDDRVKIFHDEKPEKEVIDKIKKSGFRWSPFWKCWCRKHTARALEVAKFVVS